MVGTRDKGNQLHLLHQRRYWPRGDPGSVKLIGMPDQFLDIAGSKADKHVADKGLITSYRNVHDKEEDEEPADDLMALHCVSERKTITRHKQSWKDIQSQNWRARRSKSERTRPPLVRKLPEPVLTFQTSSIGIVAT